MDRVCPHCGSVELALETGGTVERCGACGRSAIAGSTASAAMGSVGGSGEGDPSRAERAGPREGARLPERRRPPGPGEVPMLPAAAAALLATGVFYGLLRGFPQTRLAELFCERGWVQYAITFVSCWVLALLAAKRRRLTRERKLLARDWLFDPLRVGPIEPGDVESALARITGQPGFDGEAILPRRLVRGLRQFQVRRRVAEVVEFLALESRADESRVDASYSLIRVFIWAVPTLGFIGTVIGIGSAVAGFSTTLESAATIDAMRESIGSVTGGLGVAFDTTLLALVMSILIMFPSSSLQRLEEAFLGEVDEYCVEHLVGRLAVGQGSAGAEDPELDGLVERIVAALRTRDRSDG